MAYIPDGEKYIVVESGDSVTQIAEEFFNNDISKLCAINNLSSPENLRAGMQLYASEKDKKGYNAKAPVYTSTRVAVNGPYARLTNPNQLYITWSWGKLAQTDYFQVKWTYSTLEGVEWIGRNESISVDQHNMDLYCQDSFNIPSDASIVWVQVKPVSKEKSSGLTSLVAKKYYFTADWSNKKNYTVTPRLSVTPGAPNVSLIDSSQYLKAELQDLDLSSGVTKIEWQCVTNDIYLYDSRINEIDLSYNYASITWKVRDARRYKVRCRLIRYYTTNSGTVVSYSEWSDYSETKSTRPDPVESGITELKALSESSIYVGWSPTSYVTETEYVVEYTTDVSYFDSNPDGVPSKTVVAPIGHVEITDLESGKEYFVRICASNESGKSDWSEIQSIVIGTTPNAPTTWSTTSMAIVGELVTLYWSHNSDDNSKWRNAQIRRYLNGVQVTPDLEITNTSTDDEEEDTVGYYELNTLEFFAGSTFEWQVKTRGITADFGEWSVKRSIDIYEEPSLELSVTNNEGEMLNELTSFPFRVHALAGPKEQAPISYHVSIVANSSYQTTDPIGNPKTVIAGEEVYTKHFDTRDNPLEVTLSANNVDLENNISYSVKCTVSMNSGLIAEASHDFVVTWAETSYEPIAAISIDKTNWTALINPYCESYSREYHKVSLVDNEYVVEDSTIIGVYGEPVIGATTTSGEQVFYGTLSDETVGYYCTVESFTMIEGVTLSVYRREFDGSFTELATDQPNRRNNIILDPHPALDYARYRIVATTDATGAIGYYDVLPEPVDCSSIIIQWDEEWSTYLDNEETGEDPVDSGWSGSLLELKYNVDVSDTYSPDVELVQYIGRSTPTSYYGTQQGHTSRWKTEIPKDDVETLYAIRRLSAWMGDVYVREPSGSGYWAHVQVAFDRKHKEVTIPVDFSITRVEGGM